jgi:hypothetical protein
MGGTSPAHARRQIFCPGKSGHSPAFPGILRAFTPAFPGFSRRFPPGTSGFFRHSEAGAAPSASKVSRALSPARAEEGAPSPSTRQQTLAFVNICKHRRQHFDGIDETARQHPRPANAARARERKAQR